MNLSDFGPLIGLLFTDRMSINRYVTVTNPDQTTDTILPEVPLYQNVSCRISFSSGENPANSEIDETPVKLVPKVFCAVPIDIQPADMIVVQRLGSGGTVLAEYRGTAGLAAVYPTHKEFLFSLEESA